MKIVLTDKTYDGDVRHEVEDKYLGSDLSLMFEYLENYKQSLEGQIKSFGFVEHAHSIVWQAKVDKIKALTTKYKPFIEFLAYIDSEENAL